MPEFCYTARRATGEDVVGEITAGSQREAIALLSGSSLFPLTVESAERQGKIASWKWPFWRRVGSEAISSTLTQMADLLENGVPLLESLRILADQSPHPELQRIMTDVHDQVAEGVSLDDAMARHSAVFSELTLSMVRAGMEGAFLEEALRRVASFLERYEELKGKVLGALSYPVFLSVIGLVVTVVLVVFFVPRFETLFERLESSGQGLPVATTMLLATSDFLARYGVFVLVGLAGVGWLVRQQMARDDVQRWMDAAKLKLPLAGKILHNAAVSRFCRVLGTLLRNGVPILKALRISSGSSGNRLLADAITESAENVSSGESLAKPLSASGLLPPNVMAMIAVAEQSNSLDTVLVKIADRIDQRMERQLSVMVRLLEPMMLVLIGGAVMFILVALLLPVIEASTTVG